MNGPEKDAFLQKILPAKEENGDLNGSIEAVPNGTSTPKAPHAEDRTALHMGARENGTIPETPEKTNIREANGNGVTRQDMYVYECGNSWLIR